MKQDLFRVSGGKKFDSEGVRKDNLAHQNFVLAGTFQP
jgi:hypothetical protein